MSVTREKIFKHTSYIYIQSLWLFAIMRATLFLCTSVPALCMTAKALMLSQTNFTRFTTFMSTLTAVQLLTEPEPNIY